MAADSARTDPIPMPEGATPPFGRVGEAGLASDPKGLPVSRTAVPAPSAPASSVTASSDGLPLPAGPLGLPSAGLPPRVRIRTGTVPAPSGDLPPDRPLAGQSGQDRWDFRAEREQGVPTLRESRPSAASPLPGAVAGAEGTELAPAAETAEPAPAAGVSRLSGGRMFAAFRHRNYRLYFTGQLISQIGTWMQQVAQGWLMYSLTGSPLALGLTGFTSAIPAWFLSLGVGVIVDRVPRRQLILITQICAMLLAFVLAALVFAGVVQPWHILVLALLLGIVNVFDVTARQTFVKDMVGREDMANAIALNSALFNLSRIMGPALAGITLALVGPAWCFLLNGLSYLAVIYVLAVMSSPPFTAPARMLSMWSEIKEGLAYVRQSTAIKTLMGVVCVSSIFGFTYSTLLPAYAQDVMHVNAEGLGFMSTAVGLGALIGALAVASLADIIPKGKLLTIGNLVFPSMLIMLSLSRSYPLSLFILVFVGFGFMIQQATSNTLLQTNVPDHLRGRVLSVYMLLGWQGMQPIGAIQAGVVAETFGVPVGIGLGAVVLLLFGLLLLWRVPRLRHMS